jgi:penicillin-binding protein 2
MPIIPRRYKIKRKYRDDIGPEEIFLDSQRLRESPDGEKEKIEKPIKESTLKIFLVMITVVLGLLLFKSLQLQIIKGNYWRSMADENRIRSYPIRPLRGIIYDKNKTPLAINVPKLDLVLIPADLEKNENLSQVIDRLSLSLKKPREEIEKKINDNLALPYPIIIEEDIEREKAFLLESNFNDIPEISIVKNSFRQYESGEVFSHILGYLGKADKDEVSEKKYLFDDYVGRIGLEKIYDEQLRGKNGEQLTEVDNIGKLNKILAIKDAETGSDLILSIDAGLQKKIYDSLKAKLGTLSTSRAAAIAVNPQNGKILALVSLPGFNNNQFIRGLSLEEFNNIFNNKNEPLFNRAISGLYPPGSTIKPMLASGALTENIINPNRQINCPGYLNLVDKFSSNIIWTHNDWKAHGPTDMIKAIAESCDVYFYTIGGGYGDIEGLGIERIKKYLKLFGLGEVSGIDLIGEKPGFIPDTQWKEEVKKEKWYIGDTYNASIGQGDVLASPLQIAMATSVVANNGTLFRPQLIEGEKPEIVRKDIIKKEFLEIVRKGMREAVVSGSSRLLSDLVVKAAGKTGTAETAKNKTPHSWFTVFAPYENPEIVITILIENGGEGSSTAVPVAKDVLNWYFRDIAIFNNI